MPLRHRKRAIVTSVRQTIYSDTQSWQNLNRIYHPSASYSYSCTARDNTRRNTRKAPPPQPIMLPETVTYDGPPTPTSPSNDRNAHQKKGLMQRLRRKTDATPNEQNYPNDGKLMRTRSYVNGHLTLPTIHRVRVQAETVAGTIDRLLQLQR